MNTQNSISEIIDNPDLVTEAKTKTVATIKAWIFDLIALALIIAMFLLGLGAFGFAKITWQTILDTIISFVPFYLSLQLLNLDYYTKGVFKGKEADVYKAAISGYSELTSSLTGEQHDKMNDFCDEFNNKALIKLQTAILRRASISYELFAEGNADTLPLKQISKEELLTRYNKEVVKIIQKAKNVRVKGISPNVLLSNVLTQDSTDLGKSEKDLMKQRTTVNAIVSFLSVFVLCLISIKDIQQWGWIAAALVLFKMVYIFVASYMKYFTAYQDITVDVVNYLARKTDILKQFCAWYTKYQVVEVTSNIDAVDVIPLGVDQHDDGTFISEMIENC